MLTRAAMLTCAAEGASGSGDRPNIVLFIGDDMSQEDFEFVQTPYIDKLAANGLSFSNAYQTTSSCSPVRTSLITGRYPHNTGGPELHQMNNPHLGNLPQFPHLLREAGYYTAQAGKQHFNGDVVKSFDKERRGGGSSGAEYWLPSLRDRPRDKPFFMWFAASDAHRNWDQSLDAGPHSPEDVVVPPYLVDGPATRRDLAYYYNEIHRFDNYIGLVVEELEAQNVLENTLIIVIGEDGRPFPRSKCWMYDSGIKTPLVVHWPAGLSKQAEVDSLVSWIDLPPTILEFAGVEVPPTFQGVSLRPIFEDPKASVRDFVFAERNWHAQRHHERMVRHGDFVYIRNHYPELVGMNLVHHNHDLHGIYGDTTYAYVELVEHWRAGKATPAQLNVVAQPRPAEELYNVVKDPHQLENLAGESEFAEQLAFLGAAMDKWMEQTGDTVPALEDMTPDRGFPPGFRESDWSAPLAGSGRPDGGEFPGQSTDAWKIHHPGPVRTGDVKLRRRLPQRRRLPDV